MVNLSHYERSNLSSYEREALQVLQDLKALQGEGSTVNSATAINQNEQTALLEVIRDRLLITGLLSDASLITESPLTAVGSTTARSMAGYKELSIQLDITGIGTSVAIQIEGSLTGNNWINLNPENTASIINLNGSYLFTYTGKLGFIRVNLVNINGGTPSITTHILRGN